MSTTEIKPVTVIARHAVPPGKEPIFEEWVRGIFECSSNPFGNAFGGHYCFFDELSDHACGHSCFEWLAF